MSESGPVPFTIHVPDEVLVDLRRRLAATRLPPASSASSGWEHGTDPSYLRELLDYWMSEYDWRAIEDRLNACAQFITQIDGQPFHFLHTRSPEPDALPLLITHGWPGSIVEFLDVVGPLTDPAGHGGDARDAFHVVTPSLPGFGFSSPLSSPGWNVRRTARAWAQLMAGLGYQRYAAQGGDWGAIVTEDLARIDAPRLVGIHLNMLVPPIGERDATDLSPDEVGALAAFEAHLSDGGGYSHIQSTRPQTIGVGLDDSPAGLASWIVDKFRAWSDCDGDVERSFTKDQLLDNIMLYWVTQTGASSARYYREYADARRAGSLGDSRSSVPCGYARYPAEPIRTSRRWAARTRNLVHFGDMPRGGHFAAFEQPELFVDDVRACFRELR